MSFQIRRIQYFYTTVKDRPGEAYRVLADLADAHVNLLAFSVVPLGPELTQLALFPENPAALVQRASKRAWVLTDPQWAILIQGDDQLGALVDLHHKLYDARINVYASSGVADGRGGYGYVLYVKADDFENACHTLGL